MRQEASVTPVYLSITPIALYTTPSEMVKDD